MMIPRIPEWNWKKTKLFSEKRIVAIFSSICGGCGWDCTGTLMIFLDRDFFYDEYFLREFLIEIWTFAKTLSCSCCGGCGRDCIERLIILLGLFGFLIFLLDFGFLQENPVLAVVSVAEIALGDWWYFLTENHLLWIITTVDFIS